MTGIIGKYTDDFQDRRMSHRKKAAHPIGDGLKQHWVDGLCLLGPYDLFVLSVYCHCPGDNAYVVFW